MLPMECFEIRQQKILQRHVARADPDLSHIHPQHARNAALARLDLSNALGNMAVEQPAFLSQPHSLRLTDKQRAAERFLQLPDALADRRLRNIELFRRAGDAAERCNRTKHLIGVITDIHGVPSRYHMLLLYRLFPHPASRGHLYRIWLRCGPLETIVTGTPISRSTNSMYFLQLTGRSS